MNVLEDDAPVATMSQAVDEWAHNVGWHPRFIDQQWLSHDYDVWVRNPHYIGPDRGHPDDPEPEEWMTVGMNTGENDPPYFTPIDDDVADDDIPY